MDFLIYLSTLPIWLKGLILLVAVFAYLVAMTRFVAWVDRRNYQKLPDEHETLCEYTNGQSEQAEMHRVLHYRGRNKAA